MAELIGVNSLTNVYDTIETLTSVGQYLVSSATIGVPLSEWAILKVLGNSGNGDAVQLWIGLSSNRTFVRSKMAQIKFSNWKEL